MSDLISRQAAIEAVKSRKTAEQCKEGEVRNWTVDACVDMIKKMPSAQPEIIRCKDCKWKNNHNCTRAVEVWIDDNKYCAWAERQEE